jgi:hypothetical protein
VTEFRLRDLAIALAVVVGLCFLIVVVGALVTQ